MEAVILTKETPVDYIAMIEQYQREERTGKNQIYAPEFIPFRSEEPVDYLAASKAWEKAQAGKNTIYTTEQENNDY